MRTYKDPKKFWKEVTPFLRPDEAKNCLLLGVSHGFQKDESGRLYQIALFDGERFQAAGVGSRYAQYRNFLPSPVKDKAVAQKMFKHLGDKNYEFNSLIAERQTAELYRELIHARGRKTKDLMAQGVYRCRRVKMPEGGAHLALRAAEARDMKLLTEWISDFHEEAMPEARKVNFGEFAKGKISGKMVYVLEHEKTPVAMAGWSRDIGTSTAINMVYTPKKFRGKGYGSWITAKLTDRFLKEGRKETNLFTDLSNPTSNKIYKAVGYEFVCDSVHIKVD